MRISLSTSLVFSPPQTVLFFPFSFHLPFLTLFHSFSLFSRSSALQEEDGYTGLHHAAKLGSLDIVTLLLETGQVDINAQVGKSERGTLLGSRQGGNNQQVSVCVLSVCVTLCHVQWPRCLCFENFFKCIYLDSDTSCTVDNMILYLILSCNINIYT